MAQSHYVLKINYPNQEPETRNVSEATIVLGRESGDLVLGDPQSSSRHAEIHFADGRVRVQDVGSTNGTWFNGERAQNFDLNPGEWFQIGQTSIQLLAVQGAQPAATGGAKTMIAFGGIPPAPAPQGSAAAPAAGGWAPPPPGAAGAPPVAAPPVAAPPVAAPAAAAAPPSALPPMAAPAAAPAAGSGPNWGAAPPAAAPPPAAPMAAAPVPAAPAAPMPFAPQAPVAAGPYVPAPTGGASGPAIRPDFRGTGGEMLVTTLIHGFLTMITFGIYLPWFICKMQSMVASRTTLEGSSRGPLQLSFSGSGGELFGKLIGGYLLTLITLGVYAAWFVCSMLKFFYDNHAAKAADGTVYRLRFVGTGGELFVTFLVQGILTMITFGIYTPWAVCAIRKALSQRTAIVVNEQEVGRGDFVGSGGKFFVEYLLFMVLFIPTLGLYQFWFQVKMFRFFAENARWNVAGQVYGGKFEGEGTQWFVLHLVGILLCMVTLFIYFPWFLVKQLKFQYNNLSYSPVAGAGAAAAFQPQQPAVQG